MVLYGSVKSQNVKNYHAFKKTVEYARNVVSHLCEKMACKVVDNDIDVERVGTDFNTNDAPRM